MSEIKIEISNNQNTLEIDLQQLQQTVKHVLNNMNVTDALVSIAVVDDDAIKGLKEKYFVEPVVTDVISFDLSENDCDKLDCEVVVNAQLAQSVAGDRDNDPLAELNLYVVHGLLHQLGYDDQQEDQAKIMHEREDQLLEELGFGNVFGGNGVNYCE